MQFYRLLKMKENPSMNDTGCYFFTSKRLNVGCIFDTAERRISSTLFGVDRYCDFALPSSTWEIEASGSL